jgi:hypothetical protein
MTKTTHAYLPVGILASQRVRGRVQPKFNTVLERETYYYSIKRERRTREREERDVQEREERRTREREERDIQRQKTGRHARQERGKRNAFGSGPNAFFGVHAGSPVPASRILWKQLF